MRRLLRAIPMAVIYAVLAGPADPMNWLLGALLGLATAVLLGSSGRATGPGGAVRLIVRAAHLPWFLLGCLIQIAAGTRTMIGVLAFRAGRVPIGFVRCSSEAETPDGRALLALIEAASPGSIVAGLDGGEHRTSLVPADRHDEHCASQNRWYRRFQRRMLP